MSELPDILASGGRVRLFPVLADTSKEGRTLSIFLACFCAVRELGQSLLASVGKKVGSRARIEAYSEVVLKNSNGENLRPDGLITVTSGKNRWSALVEAKVGNSDIDDSQVEAYARQARAAGIDAVITISNQFVATPLHPVVVLPKTISKHVGVYHWSWMYILTVGTLLSSSEDVVDGDQRYMLREFLRFFRHPSSGVSRFDRMNTEWKQVVANVKAGAVLAKSSDEVENTIASWHQEVRDLCLVLSRKIGREVSIGLSRAHASDPLKRLKDDCESLAKTNSLTCRLDVPNAAAPLWVGADLRAQSICVSMKLQAPADIKTTRGRLNWLLRQLSKTEQPNIYVRAYWPRRSQPTQGSLIELRDNPSCVAPDNKAGMVPQSFEILLVRDLGGKFAGSRVFIDALETTVPEFYEQVGQRLKAWQPSAPKITKEPTDETKSSQTGVIGLGASTAEDLAE